MKKIGVSIIIPVYNSEKHLARCLDSVLNQSLCETEVICINDGSTDSSLEILRHYQHVHENMIVLDQKNAGPSAARNAGIAAAQGKYIAFVDSDDYIEREMYQTMYSIAEQNHLKVVLCNYINDYTDNRSSIVATFPLPDKTVLNKADIANLIYPELIGDGIFNGPCNKIYLREFITDLNVSMPADLRYGEDLIFQLEIFDKLDRTYFVNTPFYHYIHRANSLSTANKNMLESTLVPMYRIRCEYAAKWGLPKEMVAEYFVYYVLMDLVNSVKDAPKGKKMRKLRTYLQNSDFSQALRTANLLKGNYTLKIKLLFVVCRMLCR